MPMTYQPVQNSAVATLYVDVTCSNSSGTQSGGKVLLDRYPVPAEQRPPLLQAPEYQLALKGGEANTISVVLDSYAATGIDVQVIDVQWEALKR